MNTTYTFDQLKEDVRQEAEALRVHATKEELGKLNINVLSPVNFTKCIYGQMTGSCYSDRAAKLISKCCSMYFNHDVMPDIIRPRITMEVIKENAYKSKVKGFVKARTGASSTAHFSAIEAYILLPKAKNAKLIAFLKGESETLEL